MLPHKEHELKRALVSVEDGVGWLELVVATVLVLVLASPTLRATVYWLVVSVTDVPSKGSVPD